MRICINLAQKIGGSPLEWFARPVGELKAWWKIMKDFAEHRR